MVSHGISFTNCIICSKFDRVEIYIKKNKGQMNAFLFYHASETKCCNKLIECMGAGAGGKGRHMPPFSNLGGISMFLPPPPLFVEFYFSGKITIFVLHIS